jgi:hypothetical protein
MHPNVVATLRQAAALVQLDEHEIEWAVEECGYCSTDNYLILPCDGDHYVVVRQR